VAALACLPALALAAGLGLTRVTLAPRVTALAPRALSLAPQVIVLVLIVGFAPPSQLAERQPAGHGDDIRGAADVLARHERPGDGVLYDCPTCHYPDMPREFASAYPAAFGSLDDLALAESPAASGTLRGIDTSQATLARRLDQARRVWLVEMLGTRVPVPLAHSGLHRVASYPAGDLTVSLYER
jgi:mannosyltransferase